METGPDSRPPWENSGLPAVATSRVFFSTKEGIGRPCRGLWQYLPIVADIRSQRFQGSSRRGGQSCGGISSKSWLQGNLC